MWAWWKGTCRKQWSESAWGSATDCEKEIFFLSLHVKLELLLRQTGSQKIYTHKRTKSNVCWLNQASLKHTHTHLLLSHTHWTFQMGRSAIQWRWATAVEERALRNAFSFVFLLEFLEFVHVKGLVFERSCEEGWIRRSLSPNGLTKPWMSRRDEVRLVFTWAIHDL